MLQPPVVRLAEIRDSPLDVAEVLAALDAPSSGGVALFVGRVRDHHNGQSVAVLDYAAHPTASEALARVCAEVAQAHQVTALAAVHRVGRVQIGEVAVITAVATAHRDGAFSACRALIDGVKAQVPIWKYETFADGRAEWVGLEEPVVVPTKTRGTKEAARLTVMAGVVLLLTVLASLLPGAFVLYTPGPVVDVLGETNDGGESQEFIEVIGGEAYHDGGKLEMTTVYVTNPESTDWPGDVAWSWLSPERALIPRELVYPSDTTNEEEDAQSAAEMAASQDSARVVAMRAAGLTVPATITVVEVADGMPAEGILEVDDVLVSANGTTLDSVHSLLDAITATGADEELSLVIVRDGKQQTVRVPVKEMSDGSRRVGITPREEFEWPVTVEINIPEDIGGPSAGLMFSLAIYDTLTEGSLTQGAIFAGTGTISSNGQVGPIGGIQQKIAAARASGAVLFFVPVDNCAEAVGAVNGDMRLVRVSTMQDALDAIEQWHDNPDAELARCEP